MTITRVGSNDKYAIGWDTAFGGKSKSNGKKTKRAASAKKTTKAKASAAKKTVKSAKKKSK